MTLETMALGGLVVGLVTYAGLSIFFVYGWVRRITGRAALIASAATTLWFAVFLALGQQPITDLFEIAAYCTWILLLTRILGVGFGQLRDPAYRMQSSIAILTVVGFVVSLVAISGIDQLADVVPPTLLKLLLCLLGIVTLEQVARNTRRDHQWSIKYLIVGLGAIFAYGFVLYSNALLFRSPSLTLFVPQGFIYAVAAPFIAVASLRNRNQRLHVNLSRQFVFRTGTVLLAGGYLLIMGTAGYYVRFFGGEWGAVFEVFLVTAGLLGLAILASSARLRNSLRVLIVRNLYEYKYDYRDEWLRVTRELTQSNPDESLAGRAIHALTDLVHANAGAYWRLSNEGVLLPMLQVNTRWNLPLSPQGSNSLTTFFSDFNWIIDLDEHRANPRAYAGLDLSNDLDHLGGARFIVPLLLGERLFGIIAIGQPAVPIALIWEDYDILKVIARQTAGFLALHHADTVLSASKQLRAMDQLSAFVVHDLKTVIAQFSLLLRNAVKHKGNPAFIDDMLATTEHAVGQMNKLLGQLRTREEREPIELDLIEIVHQVVDERAEQRPGPVLETSLAHLTVKADPARLAAVVSHVVQNAQEATPDNGSVHVHVHASPTWAIVDIKDTGHGMTPEFIASELFMPFATTKGVAGIGVGAYQCREYVQALGGDVAVRSLPGIGTEFTLRLPLVAPAQMLGQRA
jgi:putative PEP-CTERM system histidine kinase